jgi:hypothetical protein
MIVKQKKLEFFSEWGHRWFDLKRWNLLNEVMKNVKPNSWQAYMQWYPIPVGDILYNPNLVQNEGYPGP